MIIKGDGRYGLQAAYIGGSAPQACWLGPKVGGHLAPFLYSSCEPSELSQTRDYLPSRGASAPFVNKQYNLVPARDT